MVDNRGISPVSGFNFKSGDGSAMANKMSDEKMGQGGEYFAQEMAEEEYAEEPKNYQDRSAQLRASLESLALANAGSMMVMKTLKEKETKEKEKIKNKTNFKNKEVEEFEEKIFED